MLTEQQLLKQSRGGLKSMSIKSDKWIKQMSKDYEMINPFSENQIRVDENGVKRFHMEYRAMDTM